MNGNEVMGRSPVFVMRMVKLISEPAVTGDGVLTILTRSMAVVA